MQRPDHDLLESCRRGDSHAWSEIVERYSRLVHSVPRRYGLPDADCEDVHQAVFVALVNSLGRRDRIEKLPSWLLTVAHRESWRVGRSRNRAVDLDDFNSVAEPNPSTTTDAEQEQAVREGLSQLDERCRDLLTALFSVQGEPHYPTIASRLGMPRGSIGPTRARCLAELEKILRRSGIPWDSAPTPSR